MTATLPINPMAGAADALVEWLLCDISRARRILGSHYNVGDGSCYHQGATCGRFMWPCDIFLCAQRAVVLHAKEERQHEQRRRLDPIVRE